MNLVVKLVTNYFLGITGINKFIHTKNNSYRIKNSLIILTIVFSFGYIGYNWINLFQKTLSVIFLLNISYEDVISAIITSGGIFSFSYILFGVNGILFSKKDQEQLLSLPLSKNAFISYKFLVLYIYHFIISCFILTIPLIIIGIKQEVNFLYYLNSAIVILFSLTPFLIASIITGSVLAMIFTKTNLIRKIRLILLLILTVGIVIFSVIIPEFDFTKLFIDIIIFLTTNPVIKFYGHFLASSLFNNNFLLLLLPVISVILSIVLIITLSKYYSKITELQQGSYSNKAINYNNKQRSSTILITLIKKEYKRYFASTIYVINTIISPILLLIVSAVVLIGDISLLDTFVPGISSYLSLLPLIMAAIVSLSNTTCCSISMEGKYFNNLKSLPISFDHIVISKVAVTTIMTWSSIIASTVIMKFALNLSIIEAIYCLLIPGLYSLLTAVLGLFINIIAPKLSWNNETAVVKQSLSTILSTIISIALTFVPFMILINFPYLLNLSYDIVILVSLIILNLIAIILIRTIGANLFCKIEIGSD